MEFNARDRIFPSQGLYELETQKIVFRDERTFRSVSELRGYRGYTLDSPPSVVAAVMAATSFCKVSRTRARCR